MLDFDKDENICIMDFAGNYKDCGYWYDYYPAHKVVKFGGILFAIPNMPVDHKPTEEECEVWIKKYSDWDFRPLDKATVSIITHMYKEDREAINFLQIKLKSVLKKREKNNATKEKIKS